MKKDTTTPNSGENKAGNAKGRLAFRRPNIRFSLVLYDLLIYLAVVVMLLFLYDPQPLERVIWHIVLGAVCIITARIAFSVS